MFGFSALGKAFFDCISTLINYKTVSVENQETTSIVGDKKDLKKATNIAEQIIEITRKYESSMSKKDRRRFKSLAKRFNKVD